MRHFNFREIVCLVNGRNHGNSQIASEGKNNVNVFNNILIVLGILLHFLRVFVWFGFFNLDLNKTPSYSNLTRKLIPSSQQNSKAIKPLIISWTVLTETELGYLTLLLAYCSPLLNFLLFPAFSPCIGISGHLV